MIDRRSFLSRLGLVGVAATVPLRLPSLPSWLRPLPPREMAVTRPEVIDVAASDATGPTGACAFRPLCINGRPVMLVSFDGRPCRDPNKAARLARRLFEDGAPTMPAAEVARRAADVRGGVAAHMAWIAAGCPLEDGTMWPAEYDKRRAEERRLAWAKHHGIDPSTFKRPALARRLREPAA